MSKPARLNKTNLVGLLRQMAAHVAVNDSFEGSVEYHATDEPGTFEVNAAYRVGNRDEGQGQVILVQGAEPVRPITGYTEPHIQTSTSATEVGPRRHTTPMPGAE